MGTVLWMQEVSERKLFHFCTGSHADRVVSSRGTATGMWRLLHMSSVQSAAPSDPAPGGLLYELERRQDDVLEQLDQLDAQVTELLSTLGVRGEEDESGSVESSARTDDELPRSSDR